jgi:hypothetical protein
MTLHRPATIRDRQAASNDAPDLQSKQSSR